MSEEWTISTLKEYLLTLIAANDKRYEDRFTAQKSEVAIALSAAEKAVVKAEVANERRFENTNEWRAVVSDRDKTFATSKAVDDRFSSQDAKIAALTSRIDQAQGSGMGLKSGWGYLIGAVGLIGSLIAIILAFRK